MKKVVAAMLFAAFAAPAFGQWTGWSAEDPMDDTVRKGVASGWTAPRKSMSFPDRETKAIVGISCEADPDQAYMGFTEKPNLSRGENHGGYETTRLRVRFDNGKPQRVKAIQSRGNSQISLQAYSVGGEPLRDAILGGNTMLVEIPWHGAGNVIFAFSLAGSRKAFDAQCGPVIARKEAARRAAHEEHKRRRKKAFALYSDPDMAGRIVRAAGKHCPSVQRIIRISGDSVAVRCPKKTNPDESCLYPIDVMTRKVTVFGRFEADGC